MVENHKCPKCESGVDFMPGCPTYQNAKGTGMMRCFPACGNAIEWFCENDDCDWGYTEGLNPVNNRFEGNRKYKPSWLTD